MQFPDDVRQDIKTFWGIPLGKLLKVLIPLSLVLVFFILWFPFPEMTWRLGLAAAVFLMAAAGVAVDLPKYFGIFKRYRKRVKQLKDSPSCKSSGPEPSCLQDLIRADHLHYREDKVLIEWDNGWISVLCSVQAEPIDYEKPETIALTQKGLKDALAVASANGLRLRWIDDADFEYDEAFWQEWREQALAHSLPGGMDLTADRMAFYEELAQTWAVSDRLYLRIDGELAQLMRDESGGTDFERKEQALVGFSYRVNSFREVLRRAKLTLFPLGEEDLQWLVQGEAAPWVRGRIINPADLSEGGSESELEEPKETGLESQGAQVLEDLDTQVLETLSTGVLKTLGTGILGYSDTQTLEDLNTQVLKDLRTQVPEILDTEVPESPDTVQIEQKQERKFSQDSLNGPILFANPFGKNSKKTWNPFPKGTQPEPESRGPGSRPPQKLHLAHPKPILFPDNVVVALGTKRYAGVTTVAVNLTPPGGVLVNLGRGEQPPQWPEGFPVRSIAGEGRIAEIAKLAEIFEFVAVDLGLYTGDCSDLLQVAQTLLYVTDNQPGSLNSLLEQTKSLPASKMGLVLNKAMPSGLSPGLISARLGMMVAAMIPFDPGYGENFGLSLPRKPWEAVRQYSLKHEVIL